MAINNISVSAPSEKDALLAFKDNSLENNEEGSGAEFLSQLNAAHSIIEPLQKGNKNLDAENSTASLNNEESSEEPSEEHSEETEIPIILDGSTISEVIVVSGDSMLAQISSAQAINTSVSKPTEEIGGPAGEVNGVTGEIDFKKISTTDNVEADIAIGGPITRVASEGKNISSVDSPSLEPSVAVSAITQITERDKSAAVDALITKDTDLNKASNASIKPDDLLELPEEFLKDSLKKITGGISTEQLSSLSHYNSSDYDSSLLDTQILQAQQLQSTSQAKLLSIDPSVMQAIDIVKSDAAKLLQERVSSMLSINNKEAEIRLDPPEMGSMQIRIRSDAEQAHINFVVQNQQAKEALEQSMPRLREMLAQQGLELGESTISYGQSGGESSEQGEHRSQVALVDKEAINDGAQELTDNIAISFRKQTSSSIDYYA